MNKAGKIFLIPGSYTSQDISSEAVSIPAGDAGELVDFYLTYKPVANAGKNWVGGYGDTSISFTSTIFTAEVAENTPDSDLEAGQYWIDYITGKGRGRKAASGTSLTVNYSIFV